ncbi:MAG: MMPL family transporter, partial [Pseudomonadota bacterium]|nr:MMPL family transporter [Pseudomonadota bacterium]
PALLRHLPHLLSRQQIERLPDMVTDDAIREKVADNRNLLLTPFGFAARELVLADPLGLSDLLRRSLDLPSRSIIQKGHDGYYQSEQGLFFIFIKPSRPPQDIPFSKQLMEQVAVIERETLVQAASSASPPSVAYTGGYPIAVNDEVVTKRDIQITLVTSLIGVLALFGLCFRTLRTLIHVTVPLLMSIAWTLGLAGLLFGRLNLLTCIFSCVLAGLGIDFAVHIVNRFYSDDKQGLPPDRRLADTYREAGAGIVIGGLTTAAAFFAVGISDFKGFHELGVMTGSGLLLCLAAMMIVLPALLVRSLKHRPRQTVKLAGFGLVPLLRAAGRRPRPLAAGLSVVTAALVIVGLRVDFDDNLKNFRKADDQVLRLQEQITEWLGGSSAATLLVAADTSEAALVQKSAGMWEALTALQADGRIADIGGLQAFFPSPERQRRNLAFVRDHRQSLDWTRIRRTFNDALVQNGLQRLPAYDSYLSTLETAFADDTLFLPSALTGTALEPLLGMFFFRAADRFNTVLYLRPPQDLWSRHQAQA